MFKRGFAFVLVMAAALLVLPVTVFAQDTTMPAEEVAALARYYPSDTGMFLSLRTDDAFLNGLDTLAQRLSQITGANLPVRLQDALDYVVGSVVEGGTFQNTVRSWLGDTAAMGAVNMSLLADNDESNDSGAYLLALSVTDSDAARAFMDDVVVPQVSQNADVSEQTLTGDGYTGYEFHTGDMFAYFVVFNDVMFISSSDLVLPLDGMPSATLADNAGFQTGLADLPADSYNVAVYVDTPSFMTYAMQNAQAEGRRRGNRNAMDMAMMQPYLDMVGQTIIGATALDEQTLAIDVVQQLGDTSALEAAGVNLQSMPSVDPAFAQYIAADTPLVIHGTDLGGSFENAMSMLQAMSEQMSAQSDANADPGAQIQFGMAFVGAALGGLNVQDDILSWMTGDYALVASLNDRFPTTDEAFSQISGLPFDFGFLVEATDAEKAAHVVMTLQTVLQNAVDNNPSEMTIDTTRVGGGDMVTVTLQNSGTPFPVQVAFGSNAAVFAIGTPAVVENALNPAGSLETDPRYVEASAYVLPNATQVLYLAGEPLLPIADFAGTRSGGENNPEEIRRLLTLFHSSSISSMRADDGSSVSRAVITLP
ncbi:MAG: DUF3352 domain-containing protein [Anaerolineae bacterium]